MQVFGYNTLPIGINANYHNFLKFLKQDITFIDKCLEKGNLLVKIGLPNVFLVI